ncbi:lysophospholipid acyltransferase family protein [Thalassobaculum sp. OXR-137]|uniref:lysophospholipid acyltransferase family protein n=1 Tax=Thalassobaculum sp. OXR-137 TaxID=3100173 RepID=UPI002AC9DC1B|nr:lysophospholipid acyltransferase family protein [Thalassobaculum sp. OXR-137]WPZ35590.1 lysophospholipid acyltransferase family protein [Thalassobaculum sp. OXR-137]
MADAVGGSTTTHRLRPVFVDEAEERRLLDHGQGMIRSETRAAIRLTAYLLLTVALMPVQAVAVMLRLRLAERLPRFYHRLCTRILGIQVIVRGRRVRERPVLFVSNHVSYLDITALGSAVTGCFIAKSEVAGWPLFGLLAKLQRTVFIARKRTAVAKHGDEIAERLEAGDNLILFPEGTSGDGTRVLPFKSAFFAVAERRPGGRPLTVQPVSIAYTKLNEVPLGRGLRPFFAWYGDMDLAPHLWTVAALGKLTVVIEFHQPVTVDEAGSRKALASRVQEQVAAGLARANAGR